ncbi:hypothetical protein ACTJJ0_21070 [Chitinophaga sp. 22321]|uniref:YcxB-like protein n=1 Tax=Chitinophaga hostae TaxID=2831022 RepID=A0ABS5J429_9BACT|nr:hypothetical protein [Chitinophaga hostae]MBS0029979.1 hypothetical protein [Chitinophaga hostae]
MKHISRSLYPDEIRLLNKLKTKLLKKKAPGFQLYQFIPVLLTGMIFIYMINLIRVPIVTVVFGTIAIGCFLFVVMTPYESYRKKQQAKKRLSQVNHFLLTNEVEVTVIHARRIALACEYEDEGDLLLVEYEADAVLYLWDHDYRLKKRFPCLHFEIYKDDFASLTGRPVNALSERIVPAVIDAGAKWNYLKKHGGPVHMTTEQINFEELLERF